MSLLAKLARSARIGGEHPELPLPDIHDAFGQYASGRLAPIFDAIDCAPDTYRDEGDYTHASSLLKECPRAIALRLKYPGTIRQVPRGMRLLWGYGRSAERHVRDVLTQRYPEQAYGRWECKCGESAIVGTYTESQAAGECKRCVGAIDRYRELTFFDETYGVAGNPDFLLRTPAGLVSFEFKSANAKGFMAVADAGAPVDQDNVNQAVYYVRLGTRAKYRMAGYAVLVYIAKDYKWGQVPYLDFRVSETDCRNSAALDEMDRGALAIREYRVTGKLPERLPACAGGSGSRVKTCDMCAMCFGEAV